VGAAAGYRASPTRQTLSSVLGRPRPLLFLYLFWFLACLAFSASFHETGRGWELVIAVAFMAVIPTVWTCLVLKEFRRTAGVWKDSRRKVEP
jgi:hypothetical protein